MKKKLISSIIAAATAFSAMTAFSCTGYAEDGLMRIISVPMESIEGAEDLKIMCGGYFSLKAEKNGVVYISDDVIENWRQTGEFTYEKVKTDTGIENFVPLNGFGRGDNIVLRDPDSNMLYLAKPSEDRSTFVTLKEDDGWYIADARGYCTYVTREDNTFYYTIEKPDGSTVGGKASGEHDENNAIARIMESYNGDYIFLYTISEKSEQTDNGWVYTYGLYGVDENGTETKLCEVENVTSADAPTNYDYIFSEKFTKTDGTVTRLCVDTSGRLITIDASTVFPKFPDMRSTVCCRFSGTARHWNISAKMKATCAMFSAVSARTALSLPSITAFTPFCS